MARNARRIVLALASLLLVVMTGRGDVPAYADDCEVLPAFAALRAAIGADVVGGCVGERAPYDNGDIHQRTSGGELIWRTSDGRAAFTDGNDTWLIGPAGLVHRPNGERFFWETTEGNVASAPPSSALPATMLPGSILPQRRILSYYGNPLSNAMGILGELPPEALIARLHEQAAAYSAADPSHPIQPALELVAVVAQAGPGGDGLYRLRMDTELIEQVAGWAEDHGFLLILDVQVGRSTVADEVRALLPFLRRPYVHLAIDPEFAMSSSQVPGRAIGSHGAQDVNVAIDLLADVVADEHLPPKVLLVHRFTDTMLDGHDKLKSDPRVQVSLIMDGFGPPEVKRSTWDRVIRGQGFLYNGFKLFYRQDVPLMPPDQVVELEPTPLIVIYQ
jgi:hypothetical protein